MVDIEQIAFAESVDGSWEIVVDKEHKKVKILYWKNDKISSKRIITYEEFYALVGFINYLQKEYPPRKKVTVGINKHGKTVIKKNGKTIGEQG